MDFDSAKYATPVEVARILGRHPETVRRWCRSGALRDMGVQVAQFPGGRYLIRRSDLGRITGLQK